MDVSFEAIQQGTSSAKLCLEVVAGSIAYGLNTPDSDRDVRGVFTVPSSEKLSLLPTPNRVSDGESDTEYFELARFMELASNCNPNILEILFTPNEELIYINDIGRELLDNRQMFVSKRAFHTFSGYAHAQWNRCRGQNKWVNNPQPQERPCVLDFAYFIPRVAYTGEAPLRPIPLTHQEWLGNLERNFIVSAMEHMPDVYRIYPFTTDKPVFRGTPPVVHCESVPKEAEKECVGLLYVNSTAFTRAVSNWKQYWDWMKNRNEARYRTQEEGITDYDCKNVSHTFRLMYSGINILKEGCPIISFADHPKRQFLMDIKAGAYKFEDLEPEVNRLKEQMESAQASTSLPKHANLKKIDALYKTLQRRVGGE